MRRRLAGRPRGTTRLAARTALEPERLTVTPAAQDAPHDAPGRPVLRRLDIADVCAAPAFARHGRRILVTVKAASGRDPAQTLPAVLHCPITVEVKQRGVPRIGRVPRVVEDMRVPLIVEINADRAPRSVARSR
jgi:hypothetical protein